MRSHKCWREIVFGHHRRGELAAMVLPRFRGCAQALPLVAVAACLEQTHQPFDLCWHCNLHDDLCSEQPTLTGQHVQLCERSPPMLPPRVSPAEPSPCFRLRLGLRHHLRLRHSLRHSLGLGLRRSLTMAATLRRHVGNFAMQPGAVLEPRATTKKTHG